MVSQSRVYEILQNRPTAKTPTGPLHDNGLIESTYISRQTYYWLSEKGERARSACVKELHLKGAPQWPKDIIHTDSDDFKQYAEGLSEFYAKHPIPVNSGQFRSIPVSFPIKDNGCLESEYEITIKNGVYCVNSVSYSGEIKEQRKKICYDFSPDENSENANKFILPTPEKNWNSNLDRPKKTPISSEAIAEAINTTGIQTGMSRNEPECAGITLSDDEVYTKLTTLIMTDRHTNYVKRHKLTSFEYERGVCERAVDEFGIDPAQAARVWNERYYDSFTQGCLCETLGLSHKGKADGPKLMDTEEVV